MVVQMKSIKTNFLFSTILALVISTQSVQADPIAQANERADVALKTLMTHIWDNNQKTFTMGGNYWHYALALDAAVMAEARHASKENKDRVDQLFYSQKKRGFLQRKDHVYYDDENWMAMSLIRAYQVRNKPEFLSTAIALFDHIEKAEVVDTNGNSRGIWWDDRQSQIATASNMGPVITAAMLYQVTKNVKYLNFGKRIYGQWYKNMVIKDTFQVIDNIKPNGVKDTVPLTYDQGLAVGAALSLYKTTGDFRYLDHAKGYANYVLKNMTNNGILVERICTGPGRIAECRKNPDLVLFKGITYRYLVKLALDTPEKNVELNNMLTRTAEALWSRARDPKTGLFAHEWDGSDHSPYNTFSSSASAALGLAGYARFVYKACDYL